MTGELTFTFGLVKPAVSFGVWFGAGLLDTGGVVAKVEPELAVEPPRFFQSTNDPPTAATSTMMIIANGKYFFMILRMHRGPRHFVSVTALSRSRHT